MRTKSFKECICLICCTRYKYKNKNNLIVCYPICRINKHCKECVGSF